MLIAFRCKNYKTYQDETVFSMVEDHYLDDTEELEASVVTQQCADIKIRTLIASVIYGPNASGKTNIIEAMDLLKTIVLNGDIRTVETPTSCKHSITYPCIILNKDTRDKSLELSIEFIHESILFQYDLVLDLGVTTSQNRKRIILERLYINNQKVFSRKLNTLQVIINKSLEEFFIDSKQNIRNLKQIAETELVDTELFLTNGFKHLFSEQLVQTIYKWFETSFMICLDPHQVFIYPTSLPRRKIQLIENAINTALQNFGINQNKVVYTADESPLSMTKISIVDGQKIPAALYESLGTLRFMHVFPLLATALSLGGTVIFDELDASIHPAAIINIVQNFHDLTINVNDAQLIFNTHNPIFLNDRLFRRDEIKFVDRDEYTGKSELYQLSDFRTHVDNPAKDLHSYMRNYFLHRYGGIRDVDFSHAFRQLIENDKER
ncbi:MAG: ATP-binding protein [Planctomycetia bacterium]|nr:ATP-binding protein [Planctomycetia bacterium]